MTDLYAITGLPTDSEEYLALSSRVQIIQPVDLEWIPAISKVLVRHANWALIPHDFRLVPTYEERVAIEAESRRLCAIRRTYTDCYRFFMTGKAYFAASNVTGGLGATVDATADIHNDAAWAVAAYVDTHPTYSFWALDVIWNNPGLVVANVYDGSSVALGDTLPADAFYQVLVAKLTGSCCR